MDITKVTDIKELKSIAYDTVQALEVQQNNLRLIQQRIAELENTEETKGKK